MFAPRLTKGEGNVNVQAKKCTLLLLSWSCLGYAGMKHAMFNKPNGRIRKYSWNKVLCAYFSGKFTVKTGASQQTSGEQNGLQHTDSNEDSVGLKRCLFAHWQAVNWSVGCTPTWPSAENIGWLYCCCMLKCKNPQNEIRYLNIYFLNEGWITQRKSTLTNFTLWVKTAVGTTLQLKDNTSPYQLLTSQH